MLLREVGVKGLPRSAKILVSAYIRVLRGTCRSAEAAAQHAACGPQTPSPSRPQCS